MSRQKGFTFANVQKSVLPYNGERRMMALYVSDQAQNPHFNMLSKQCTDKERAQVLADRTANKYRSFVVRMLTDCAFSATMSTHNAGNCDSMFNKNRFCQNVGNTTYVNNKKTYPVAIQNEVLKCSDDPDLTKKSLAEEKSIFVKGQEISSDGKSTMGLKGKIAYVCTALTTVVVSGEKATVKSVYPNTPKGLKKVSSELAAICVETQFSAVQDDDKNGSPSIRSRDDMYNGILNSRGKELRNIYGGISDAAPERVSQGNIATRSGSSQLLHDIVITDKGFKKWLDLLLLSRSNTYKGISQPRVCAMFDGLPLNSMRKHMDILHDMPAELNYDAVYLQTKDCTLANRILKLVVDYKERNKHDSKTVVYYQGDKVTTLSVTKKLFADGKVIESGIMPIANSINHSGKILVYLIGKTKFAINKVHYVTIAGARSATLNDRVAFLKKCNLDPTKVDVVHRVHALSLYNNMIISKEGVDKYKETLSEYLVPEDKVKWSYALSAAAYNGLMLEYTGASYPAKSVKSAVVAVKHTGFATYCAYVHVWTRNHGCERKTSKGEVITFVRPTFYWYAITGKEIVDLVQEMDIALATDTVYDDLDDDDDGPKVIPGNNDFEGEDSLSDSEDG